MFNCLVCAQVLSEVLEHDPSSKVRCSIFLCVNETVESEPRIEMLKLILAGMEVYLSRK